MERRHLKTLRIAVCVTAALVAVGGCNVVDRTILPSGSTSSDSGVQLGSTNFTVPGVTQFSSSGTAVGNRVADLRGELEDIQGQVRGENEQLQQLRQSVRQSSVAYNQDVAEINTRLQIGTTPGNPRLLERFNNAQTQLDNINNSVSQMNNLLSQVSGTSAMTGYLLDATQATFSVRGAVDEDHQQLAVLQDETSQTAVVTDRLLNELTTDIARASGFVSAERGNMTSLAVAIDNGQYIGTSLASLTSGTPTPPPVGGGQSLVGTREPLVIIRFDRPNVDYESVLYSAVSSALERRPNAAFDVVAVSPGGRGAGLNTARSRRNAEEVVRSLANLGLPLDRVSLAATSSPQAQVDEVYVFVR